MTGDPCLQCPLADCDEKSKQCLLRIAINNYQHCRRYGLAVTDEARLAYSKAITQLYGHERFARRSEKEEQSNESCQA